MTYNWCHGPDCHTKHTVDRVRGSKGNKVLRTKKVTNKYGRSMFGNGGTNIWNFFCNHQCLMDFMSKHTEAVVSIAPRREPLETPIKDPVKETNNNGYYNWNNWTIEKKVVDNA
jgi:hypothetical protein